VGRDCRSANRTPAIEGASFHGRHSIPQIVITSILWPESRTGSTAVSTAGLKLCDKNCSPIRMVRSPWGLGVYHAIMGLQEEFSNTLSELGILRSMEEGGERWLVPARGAALIVSQRVHWASLPRE
jgi:hypothetical protein